MSTIRCVRLIGLVVFVVMLPSFTSGQQSILLQPNEQAPILPPKLPAAKSTDNVPSTDSNLTVLPVAATVAVPVAPLKSSAFNLLKTIRLGETDKGMRLDLIVTGSPLRFETRKLEKPPRIVIDLFGFSPDKKLKKLFHFNVGNVRVGAHADKTRVVVDLSDSAASKSYQVLQTGNGLQIQFSVLGNKSASSVPLASAQNQALPVPSKEAVPSSMPSQDASGLPKVMEDSLPVPIKKQQFTKRPLAISQQPISLDLRDAEIRNVLRFMAEASGTNIVVADHISGRVSIQLKNVPWEDALNAILQVAGLGYVQIDGIIRVLPLDAMEKEQNSRLLNSQLAESNLPLVTQVFPVNYATAQTLLPQIKEMLGARGRVSVNERTNVLIISDTESNIDQINRLIQTLDTQTPQVLIEARMVEARTQFSRSLGIQWGGSVFGVEGGVTNPTGYAASGSGNMIAPKNNYAVNLPASSASSAIGVSFGTIGNMAVLNARLSAAETDRQAKTVSMPKIMTLDNKAARITQGFRIPYTVLTNEIVQTQFVEAALQLDVTPHVTSDGAVQMSVKISQNMPDFSKRDNLGIPAIMVKEATTELLVKDGDTAVIGGIYTRNMLDETKKVPWIGSVPVLGWLFRNNDKLDDQSEMMVFLTPRLLNRGQSTVDTGLVESKPAGLNKAQ